MTDFNNNPRNPMTNDTKTLRSLIEAADLITEASLAPKTKAPKTNKYDGAEEKYETAARSANMLGHAIKAIENDEYNAEYANEAAFGAAQRAADKIIYAMEHAAYALVQSGTESDGEKASMLAVRAYVAAKDAHIAATAKYIAAKIAIDKTRSAALAAAYKAATQKSS